MALSKLNVVTEMKDNYRDFPEVTEEAFCYPSTDQHLATIKEFVNACELTEECPNIGCTKILTYT